MPGNLFVNFLCLTLADMAGGIVLLFLIKYTRRILSISICMFLVGVVLLSNIGVAPGNCNFAIMLDYSCP